MRLLAITSICFVVLTVGCGRKSVTALRRKGVIVTERPIAIPFGSGQGRRMQLHYFGCGGLFIRDSERSIMIDPFFSNQRLLKLAVASAGLGKIGSKPRVIDFARRRLLKSTGLSAETLRAETKAVFAAHGHYDHLMDIPYVQWQWLDRQADVYVNESSYYTCVKVIGESKIHDVEPIMSVREQNGQSIDIPAPDGTVMKVYPILAAHNPHFNHIKTFSGTVMKRLEKFDEPDDRTRPDAWLEGRSLSFLIDIEKGGQIIFRVFVQSSSCSYPDGMPPKSLLAKRDVDLAVLGVASYHFSEKTYPCQYLDSLKAKEVMFIHWEDFFRAYRKPPKSVMRTDVPRFFNQVLTACPPRRYTIPAPGVTVDLDY